MARTAKWGAVAAALSFLITSIAFAAPASATEDDPGSPVIQADLKPAVQNCVSVALKQKNQQWTCTSAQFLTNFTPYGYPTCTAGPLRTANFNCYGGATDICYFP